MSEIEPMDRLCELVTELLENGARPGEIVDWTEDAIHEWRMRKRESKDAQLKMDAKDSK